jgi:hypothetical protein
MIAVAAAAVAGFVAVGNASAFGEMMPPLGTEYEQGHNRRPDI